MTSSNDSRGGLLSAGGILSIIVGVCEIVVGGLSVIATEIGTPYLSLPYRNPPNIENAGTSIMGIGSASGEDRARKAAQSAINSTFLETNINVA